MYNLLKVQKRNLQGIDQSGHVEQNKIAKIVSSVIAPTKTRNNVYNKVLKLIRILILNRHKAMHTIFNDMINCPFIEVQLTLNFRYP